MLLEACGTEASFAARGCGERGDFGELRVLVPRNDHLRDLHAARNPERRVAMIDQDRFDFAAIIAVDGARRVQTSDTVIEREAGARTHLRFVSVRKR